MIGKKLATSTMCTIGIVGRLLVIAGLFLILRAAPAEAAVIGKMQPEVRLFSDRGVMTDVLQAYDRSFRGGVSVALGDVDGDGQAEVITAAGPGGGPEVRTYSQDGSLRSRFFAYGRGFRGGVRIAAADLDGDGRAEIVTGPGPGGGPEIRVFDGRGTKLASFFAYDRGFRGGVNVAVGPLGANGEPRIVTGSGFGGSHVRSFTPAGDYAGLSLRPFPGSTAGVVVAVASVPGSRSRLVVGQERSASTRLRIYNLDRQSYERSFYAFEKTFSGGVRIAAGNVSGDGAAEIVAARGPGSRPVVRIFTLAGQRLREISAYSASFRGSVNLAAYAGQLVVGPGAVGVEGRLDLYRYIAIDLSEQQLRYYQDGLLLGTHSVSTGKWITPTPIGAFAVKNKIPVAYSKPYDLYMEWWMAFTPDGSYGLHALPFWKTANGGKRYEGVGHLGTPVSHGCIRQTLAEAKQLFRWATVSTPVIVQR
ncbi:MAG: L,D-transpeptidase family protein [Candidatus Kerfeldbacteria bacterium]|nr:L,D-transpeptidase family protein [Candidatus Kerfeldbacteria bacterium]